MKLVHLFASFGLCSWVVALPSPENQVRNPAANRPDPLCTTTKHTTTSTSTKRTSTSTKYSTSSTKKTSTTSTKRTSSTTKKVTSTNTIQSTTSTKGTSSTTKKVTSTSSYKGTSTNTVKSASSTKASSRTSSSLPSVTSKVSTTSVSSATSLPAPSSSASSTAISIPVTVVPTSLISSITSLLSVPISSVVPPVSSATIGPVCVPATGEAVTNGGFADDLSGWTYNDPNDPDVYSGYVFAGYGLAADADNVKAFRHQAQDAGVYTLSLSQTLCLIPGVPYTISFHTGILAFPNGLQSGSGATYALSADGEQIVPPSSYCGADPAIAGNNNIGTCTEPGAGNGYLKNYYEQTTLTYIPITEEVTFSFHFTYDIGPDDNRDANLFDLFSVTQTL